MMISTFNFSNSLFIYFKIQESNASSSVNNDNDDKAAAAAAAKRKGSFKKWLRSSHRKFTSNSTNRSGANLKDSKYDLENMKIKVIIEFEIVFGITNQLN